MPIVTLEGVRASVHDRVLFQSVDLSIDAGERVALLGANGSGKSTMVRLLAGLEAPESGSRVARRGLSIGVLEQEPKLDLEWSAREIVRRGLEGRAEWEEESRRLHEELARPDLTPERLEALLAASGRVDQELERRGGHDIEHKVESILDHLSVPRIDRRAAQLSGGERRRVALARTLINDPDLLVLDEPTNHLDALAVDWLEDLLLETRSAVFLVTHDRYVLDRLAHRICELEGGRLHFYEGNYSDYLAQRMARLEAEASRESSRLNLLRRETAWMRRGAPARTTKQKARITRFGALVAAEPGAGAAPIEFSLPPGPRLGERVLACEQVSVSRGGRPVLRDLELTLVAGERIGVLGKNGVGKTTLLALLAGELVPDRGRVLRGETVRLARIDQERSALAPDTTVQRELAGLNDNVSVGGRAVRIEAFLDRFGFGGSKRDTRLGDLSGGERARLCLARMLLADANVLILDEPTNDLDLTTLRSLEEALIAFPGSVVVTSHDRWFLDRVATRILAFDGQGRVREHIGDVAPLIARMVSEQARAESPSAEAAAAPPPAGTGSAADTAGTPGTPAPQAAPGSGANPPKKRRLAPWEERELVTLTAEIERVEAEMAGIDARLCDPAVYAAGREEAERLRARRAECESRSAALYARWEALEG
jgi:ATP-binding cassette subfamily F protein uup